MKNLFQKDAADELIARLATLTPRSKALWGKMNAGQAVAHCIVPMEVALGERQTKWAFIGRLFGRMAKGSWLGEKPVRKNSPTDPAFVMTGEHDLGVERSRLEDLVRRFQQGGASARSTAVHSFFGPLTPDEWARLMYKHIDHHLQQFGA